jgi:hypothetical protein
MTVLASHCARSDGSDVDWGSLRETESTDEKERDLEEPNMSSLSSSFVGKASAYLISARKATNKRAPP